MSLKKGKNKNDNEMVRSRKILVVLITIFNIATIIFLWNIVALLVEWVKPIGNPVIMTIPEAIAIGITTWQIKKIIKKWQ